MGKTFNKKGMMPSKKINYLNKCERSARYVNREPEELFRAEQTNQGKIMANNYLAEEKATPLSTEVVPLFEPPELVTAVQKYVSKFRSARQKTAEYYIQIGLAVYDAKNELSDKDFDLFCNEIGYSANSSSIRKFHQIGNHAEVLGKHSEILPNGWTTIYPLMQLARVSLESVLEGGLITPSSTSAEILKVVAEQLPNKQLSTQGKFKSRSTKTQYTYRGILPREINEKEQLELDALVAEFLANMAKVDVVSTGLHNETEQSID